MTGTFDAAFSTRTTRDAHIALCVLVGAGALVFGGVHPHTRVVLGIFATAALARTWARRTRQSHHLSFGLMGSALVMCALWTFFQWVPLPMSVVEVIAPESAQATRAAAAAGQFSAPEWLPLSLAPTRTALGAVTLATYSAVFFLAVDVTRHGWGRLIVLAIEAVALMVLVTAIAHSMFGARSIYGVASMSLEAPFVSSFVNPKHAGALMTIGAIVALGRWLQAEARYHLGIAATLCAGVAATGSRSNLGVVVVSGLFLVWFAQRRKPAHRRRWLEMVVTFAALTILILAVFPGVWSDALSSAGRWRSDIAMHWDVASHVAAHQWWVGIGMGAFHTVAAGYLSSFEGGLLDHAHNLPLQAVADWGVPVALGVALCVGAGLLRACRVLASNLVWVAAGTALVALIIQNLVDFSLYIPGVGLSAVALAGVISGAAQLEESAPPSRGVWRPRRLSSVGVAVLLLATVTMSFHLLGHGRSVYRAQVEHAFKINMPRVVDVATMTGQHPNDYYIFRLAARLALSDGQPGRALGFLHRASELAPHHSGVRFDLARTAVAMNALVTAVDHLAIGARGGPRARARAAEVVARWPMESVAMAQFLVSSSDNAWAVIRHLQLQGLVHKAHTVGMRALRFHRANPRIWLEVLGLCVLLKDLKTLRQLAEEALSRPPDANKRWRFIGHWSRMFKDLLAGQTDTLRERLVTVARTADPRDASRLAIVEAALDVHEERWGAARHALARIHRSSLSPSLLVTYHRLLATLAEQDNDDSTALAHLHKALRHIPGDLATLRSIERLKVRALEPP